MKPQWSLFEETIETNLARFRPELTDNLIVVLEEKRERIISFAQENISVFTEGRIPGDHQSFDLLPLYFAAVYFANAEYFEYTVCNDTELVRIVVSESRGLATHKEDGLYRHRVKIPVNRFDSVGTLFAAMDAESRHAVHQNLLQEKNLFEKELAMRVFLMIAETIDEGEAAYVIE